MSENSPAGLNVKSVNFNEILRSTEDLTENLSFKEKSRIHHEILLSALRVSQHLREPANLLGVFLNFILNDIYLQTETYIMSEEEALGYLYRGYCYSLGLPHGELDEHVLDCSDAIDSRYQYYFRGSVMPKVSGFEEFTKCISDAKPISASLVNERSMSQYLEDAVTFKRDALEILLRFPSFISILKKNNLMIPTHEITNENFVEINAMIVLFSIEMNYQDMFYDFRITMNLYTMLKKYEEIFMMAKSSWPR